MSSAEAVVEETVGVLPTVEQSSDATRAATVLAVIAVMQLAWLAGLVYGAVRLLT